MASDDSRRDGRTIAVALKDDAAGDAPPMVVASGRGAFAERLLEIAFANNVAVRQDADLAEILAALEVESRIPAAAFAAVAEILAYLYRLNRVQPGAAP